jgi:signal peptidase II
VPGASRETVARHALPLAFYLIVLASLAADQLVKTLLVSRVPLGARIAVIPRLLSVTHAQNPGAAFGMLPTATGALIVAGTVIIVILLLYGRRVVACRPLWVGLALQIGGAAGNMVDRVFRGPALFRGRVVDFIDVHLTPSFTWPTFNVADIAITVGAVLIAYCIVTGKLAEAEGTDRQQGKQMEGQR